MQELLDNLNARIAQLTTLAVELFTSLAFYVQVGALAAALALAFPFTWVLRRRVPIFRAPPPEDAAFFKTRTVLHRFRALLLPLFCVVFLGIAIAVAESTVEQSWLVRAAQGLAVIWLVFTLISQFIASPLARRLVAWIGIPIATLRVFGWLDDVTTFLDGVALQVGNINFSLFDLTRTIIFGGLLFWLGRISSSAGKQVIRSQPALTVATRELVAKLFEFSLFVVFALLLLQIIGIDLTALAVFGGALGIGLGFGLQQIAANFISGVIILFDRSITIGDYVELEDGRAGTLRELNVRHAVLETFDGKDIVVPNERFISTAYTNWTHKDPRQRYALTLQVAYSTDLDVLFDNIRRICAEHPQVLSGDGIPADLWPDVEIKGFGESGIDILIEFWMEGIDDGPNRVCADLLHAIWRSVKELGVELPFPQREVRILRDGVAAETAGVAIETAR